MIQAATIPAWRRDARSDGAGLYAGAAAAGAALGLVYSLSPLTVWFVAASLVLTWVAGRGLGDREQRWVRGLLVAAIAVRAALAAWLFLFGTSDHMWFNSFFGDEQYMLVRSMRLRGLWLGAPLSLEALNDVFDVYGQTSYLNVIAYVQLLVGQAPYGIHLLNIVFYAGAALIVHRLVRRSFGRPAAFAALAGILFYPSLIIWSASALKESLHFLVVAVVVASAIALVRAGWGRRILALAVVAAGLLVLRTFRAGAFEMTAAGIAGGLGFRFLTRRLWRLAAAVAIAAVVTLPVLHNARVQDVTMRLLRRSAQVHLGHVLTRGHSYKLLDERLYVSGVQSMGWDDAGPFVRRAIVSVLLYPTPWDSQSWSELAYVPEQMLWYVVVLLAAVGFVAGLARDALVSSVFASTAAVALIVVALNTGNIGTLVRHRMFALPWLIALSAVGFTAVAGRLAAAAPARHGRVTPQQMRGR